MDRSDVKFPTARITGIVRQIGDGPTKLLRQIVQEIREIWPGDRRDQEDRRAKGFGQREKDHNIMQGRRAQTRRGNPNYQISTQPEEPPDDNLGDPDMTNSTE